MMALNLGDAPVGEAGGETVMPYIDRREAGLEGGERECRVVIKSWRKQGSWRGVWRAFVWELARSQ